MSTDYLATDFAVTLNGTPLPMKALAVIGSLEVVHEPDTLDHFALTFANDYPDLQWTHSTEALFKEGGAVEISLGYVDALERVFAGEITGVTAEFPERGTPSIRVVGHTRMHRLQGSVKTKTFVDMTDSQVAQKVGKDNGLTVKADPTGAAHPYLIQYNQTDLDFLLDRARRIHFEVLVDDKTLYFRKAGDSAQKTSTLVWGDPQALNPRGNVYPLRSFTTTFSTLRQATAVSVRSLDPKTRDPIVANARSGSEASTMGGTTTGPAAAQAAFGVAQDTVVSSPANSQEEADQLATAIYNERALRFVSGRGTAVGAPQVRAGTVTELKGLGTRFDGLYYVTESTQRYGSNGYETTFSVRRNAFG
jgi:phage protein D